MQLDILAEDPSLQYVPSYQQPHLASDETVLLFFSLYPLERLFQAGDFPNPLPTAARCCCPGAAAELLTPLSPYARISRLLRDATALGGLKKGIF